MMQTDSYDLSAPFLFSRGGLRLIEIHPTRNCNLKCRHCYSESGPDRDRQLPLDHLKRFISQAKNIGYRYIGISGGEPLLWDDLHTFLSHAKSLGLSTSLITNGTLLNETTAARLKNNVGNISVSVDSPPEEHNKLRCSSTAFSRMEEGLTFLQNAGIPFSLSFTLTRYNADRISWLYDFAAKKNAFGIQVHPLCDFGSAADNLREATPDSLEFKAASWLLALLLQQNKNSSPVATLDAVERTRINETTWPLLSQNSDIRQKTPLTDLLPSIVVEYDGAIKPFIFGFPDRWAIGTIHTESLSDELSAWRVKHSATLSQMLRTTLTRLEQEDAEYIDLFGELLKTAGDYN